MRIDLLQNRHRPWPARVLLRVVRMLAGFVPGPLLTLTYRPALFHRDLNAYMIRAMRASPAWSKGEAELIASFVSDRNTCHF